jgi:hypothetical protein
MWRWNGQISVFEPTLREIENLTGIFQKITWSGFGIDQMPRSNARVTQNQNINFVLLPNAIGGKRWYNKLRRVPWWRLSVRCGSGCTGSTR